MDASTRTDLDAILRTIQEVEVSLEHRQMRAEGTLLMIWGLVGASIMGFYQIAMSDHDEYHALLGAWLSWVWIGPMLVGYVASAIVGARLGRIGDPAAGRRSMRRSAITGAVIAVLVATLVLTQRYDLVYGSVTAISGLALVLFARGAPPSTSRTLGFAIGAAMAAAGVALLAWSTHPYAAGMSALAFLAGYLTLGTVKYRAGA